MSEGELPGLLIEELAAAQELGLIGPRSLEDHLLHATGFATAVDAPPALAADLGSGGGLPALVLAARWPRSEWLLIERRQRAVARLEVIIARLGWSDRLRVWVGPAEVAGREGELRGSHDLVTARGFGPPAMAAECGAPLLRLGGRLVVSEPPAGPNRWSAEGLGGLGLAARSTPETAYFVAEKVGPTPADYPRREGRPRRSPLW